MNSQTKHYLSLLTNLLIESRSIAYGLSRDFKPEKLNSLIENLEQMHNFPQLILEENYEELDRWIESFNN